MTRPKKAGVYVALFLMIFACVAIDSIHHHRFGPVASDRLSSPETSDPDDPFVDSTENASKPNLVLVATPPPMDPFELQVHQHGWPMSIFEHTAPFEACQEGELFAVHHLQNWRVDWLRTAVSLCLYFIISWFTSLGLWWVVTTLGAKLPLQSFFAITIIIAFELSLREQSYTPDGVHPLIFHIEDLIASFCGWVSTVACYYCAFIAFQPQFIYRETVLLLDVLRIKRRSQALDRPT